MASMNCLNIKSSKRIKIAKNIEDLHIYRVPGRWLLPRGHRFIAVDTLMDT
jgi:hypothetical protein